MTFRINANSCKNAVGTVFLLAAAFFVCSTFISMRSVFADPIAPENSVAQKSGCQIVASRERLSLVQYQAIKEDDIPFDPVFVYRKWNGFKERPKYKITCKYENSYYYR